MTVVELYDTPDRRWERDIMRPAHWKKQCKEANTIHLERQPCSFAEMLAAAEAHRQAIRIVDSKRDRIRQEKGNGKSL